jgi:hypothetical protein
MTVLDQVRDFIIRHAPKGVCDDCIADGLKLSVRQHANHKTRELENLNDFDRRVGECAVCKRTDKKVIRHDGAPMTSATITIGDTLRFIIESGPGRTEVQLADAIFGREGYQQRVNGDCRLLESRGVIERRGSGGPTEPFRYYPKVG